MKKIKIGLIGPVAPPFGGMSILTETLKKEFLTCFDVVLLNTHKNIPKLFANSRFEKVLQFFLFVKNLPSLFFCDKIFVVSSSGSYFFYKVLPALFISKTLNKPIIIDFVGGGIIDKLNQNDIRIIKWLKKFDLVIVPTDVFKVKFEQFGVKSIVFPHFVDTERFKNCSVKAKKTPVFLAAKNLYEFANVLCIIKAFKLIKESLPNAKLIIAGDGPQKEFLTDYVIENKILDVNFIGNVDYNNIPSVFSESSIFLHATRVESFGIVLIEAMASGLPIVSTNVGGIPNIIINNKNGVLIDYDDYLMMAKCAIDLYLNDEKYNFFKMNGLEESMKYSLASLSPKLIRIINDLNK